MMVQQFVTLRVARVSRSARSHYGSRGLSPQPPTLVRLTAKNEMENVSSDTHTRVVSIYVTADSESIISGVTSQESTLQRGHRHRLSCRWSSVPGPAPKVPGNKFYHLQYGTRSPSKDDPECIGVGSNPNGSDHHDVCQTGKRRAVRVRATGSFQTL